MTSSIPPADEPCPPSRPVQPGPNNAASDPVVEADASVPVAPTSDQLPDVDAPAARYGFPATLWRGLDDHPPPGLSRIRWRSPLRGPWLTSVFGATLLVVLPIVIVTGLLSYMAYGPKYGQAIPFDVGWLKLPYFDWPSKPSWLYRLNQGLHVGLGLVMIPVVLAKLWSVIPRLFAWPPSRSLRPGTGRVTLLMVVGGILFEIVTGVLNIQYDYIFGFSFYTAHYFGAWVFIAGFVSHVCLKLPTMVRSLRSRPLLLGVWHIGGRHGARTVRPRRAGGARPPIPPTLSRRGVLAVVGGGSLLVGVLTAGQTLGGFTRSAALLLPVAAATARDPTTFRSTAPLSRRASTRPSPETSGACTFWAAPNR